MFRVSFFEIFMENGNTILIQPLCFSNYIEEEKMLSLLLAKKLP